jgi:hypothetical protein
MILAAYKDPNGKINGGLYSTYEPYIKETFSPECEELNSIELKVKGKTYSECKNCLEELAKSYQIIASELPLTYGEVYLLGNFFEHNGKKYGLLQEFRENGIC